MIKAIICDILGVLTDRRVVNVELINLLIDSKGIYKKLIIYSNLSEKSIESFKMKVPEFFNIVDKQYDASNFKYYKPSSKGLEEILNEFNLKPEEVIFIDDNQTNVQEAQKLGIRTILYYNSEDISTLKTLLDVSKR